MFEGIFFLLLFFVYVSLREKVRGGLVCVGLCPCLHEVLFVILVVV